MQLLPIEKIWAMNPNGLFCKHANKNIARAASCIFMINWFLFESWRWGVIAKEKKLMKRAQPFTINKCHWWHLHAGSRPHAKTKSVTPAKGIKRSLYWLTLDDIQIESQKKPKNRI